MFARALRSSIPTFTAAAFSLDRFLACTESNDPPPSHTQGWEKHFSKAHQRKYMIIAAPEMDELATELTRRQPERFIYHPTKWRKFPDGTDKIELGGFRPVNRISGQHVIFLASFHNNDVTLSQLNAMIVLLQSFVKSFTIVLPFYPVGTMERVMKEGEIATANTYAQMLSNLPTCGQPTRVVFYDLHTLQNRFYLHGNAIASLQTTIPVLLERLKSTDINCIAFPDDGAAKRFGEYFKDLGYEIVTCGKVRDGDTRKIIIQDGNAAGKNVLIVDDLVQTGGTLHECGLSLKTIGGANKVSAFAAHGVFPNHSWKRFLSTGPWNCFDKFFITNSMPTIARQLPTDDVFEVLDLTQKIIDDIDKFSE